MVRYILTEKQLDLLFESYNDLTFHKGDELDINKPYVSDTIVMMDGRGTGHFGSGTIDEAKELWNKYFDDAAKWIKEGNTVEMVIWINMETPQSYADTLQYISTDAESDGKSIWVVKKEFFNQY